MINTNNTLNNYSIFPSVSVIPREITYTILSFLPFCLKEMNTLSGLNKSWQVTVNNFSRVMLCKSFVQTVFCLHEQVSPYFQEQKRALKILAKRAVGTPLNSRQVEETFKNLQNLLVANLVKDPLLSTLIGSQPEDYPQFIHILDKARSKTLKLDQEQTAAIVETALKTHEQKVIERIEQLSTRFEQHSLFELLSLCLNRNQPHLADKIYLKLTSPTLKKRSDIRKLISNEQFTLAVQTANSLESDKEEAFVDIIVGLASKREYKGAIKLASNFYKNAPQIWQFSLVQITLMAMEKKDWDIAAEISPLISDVEIQNIIMEYVKQETPLTNTLLDPASHDTRFTIRDKWLNKMNSLGFRALDRRNI